MFPIHLRSEIRHLVGTYPGLFYLTYGLKSLNRKLSVNKNTDIVIEGFPRSANTYAVLAFEYTNTRSFKVAHHLHVNAQIHRSTKLRIPTLVLIRPPVACISSLILREPSLSIEQALRHYISFYKVVLENKKQCVVGTFDDIIQDFGKVMARVNQKFGTDFSEAPLTKYDVEQIFKEISKINKFFSDGRELSLSAPNDNKEAAKIRVKEQLYSDKHKEKLSIAIHYYESLTQL